jgi:nicotinate-nucleotide pyrophosphorylase (carboxylating)
MIEQCSEIDIPAIGDIVAAAIEEDYRGGDITSRLCFTASDYATAVIVARENLVVCGLPLIEIIIAEFGFDLDVLLQVEEGSVVTDQTVLAEITGSAYAVLAVERTLLNFLQRLSGVASTTADFVAAAGAVTILDTRKTLPGWRYLDKYATRLAGAKNHRMNLSELIMVKDTHIDAVGSLNATLDRIFAAKPQYLPVEVEVRNAAELTTVLQYPVAIVLLDNFTDEEIATALEQIKKSKQNILVEISGGVTKERLLSLQQFDGIAVSVGSITTHAVNRDISMRIQIDN